MTKWDLVLTAEPMVKLIASKYISQYNSFGDLYSIGMIGAYKAARTYDPNHKSEMPFYGHARIRIKEAILNHINSQARRGISFVGGSSKRGNVKRNLRQFPLYEDQTSGTYANMDVIVDIIDTLKDVDPIDRDMLVQHYFDGVTMTDIATEYNITVERVRQRINRAKKLIYDHLGAYYEL